MALTPPPNGTPCEKREECYYCAYDYNFYILGLPDAKSPSDCPDGTMMVLPPTPGYTDYTCRKFLGPFSALSQAEIDVLYPGDNFKFYDLFSTGPFLTSRYCPMPPNNSGWVQPAGFLGTCCEDICKPVSCLDCYKCQCIDCDTHNVLSIGSDYTLQDCEKCGLSYIPNSPADGKGSCFGPAAVGCDNSNITFTLPGGMRVDIKERINYNNNKGVMFDPCDTLRIGIGQSIWGRDLSTFKKIQNNCKSMNGLKSEIGKTFTLNYQSPPCPSAKGNNPPKTKSVSIKSLNSMSSGSVNNLSTLNANNKSPVEILIDDNSTLAQLKSLQPNSPLPNINSDIVNTINIVGQNNFHKIIFFPSTSNEDKHYIAIGINSNESESTVFSVTPI